MTHKHCVSGGKEIGVILLTAFERYLEVGRNGLRRSLCQGQHRMRNLSLLNFANFLPPNARIPRSQFSSSRRS